MSPQSLPAVKLNKADSLPPLVLVDADNTLWDTDGVFANAQLRLLASVEDAIDLSGPIDERLSFVRSLDQELAEQHHLGLRYPPRLLIDAVAFALEGVPLKAAARKAWREGTRSGLDRSTVTRIEAEFLQNISRQPALLEGVASGLRDLAAIGARTIVLTEGNRRRVNRSIEFHELGKLVERVFEAPKSVRMFERVKKLTESGQPIFVIGDQLTRDIQPANDADVRTIYIPSRFQPKWELQTGIQPTFVAPSFDAAASYLVHFENHKGAAR